jgi:hypothetical protein
VADVTPTRVFTTDEDGRDVMIRDGAYDVRRRRWPLEAVRLPIVLATASVASVPLALIVWLARIRVVPQPGFWPLKLTLTVLPLALVALCNLPLWVPGREWGVPNFGTRLTFVGSAIFPLAAVVALALVVDAWRRGAGRWLRAYATVVTLAGLTLSAFLAVWGLIGLRLWV